MVQDGAQVIGLWNVGPRAAWSLFTSGAILLWGNGAWWEASVIFLAGGPELSLEAPWFYHTHPAPHWSHLCASATFSFSGNSCTEAAGGRVAGVSYRQEKICRLVPVGTYLTFLYVSYFLCRLRVIILMLWGGCVPQLAHGCKAQHNMGHAVNDMEKRASTSAWGWACDVG